MRDTNDVLRAEMASRRRGRTDTRASDEETRALMLSLHQEVIAWFDWLGEALGLPPYDPAGGSPARPPRQTSHKRTSRRRKR